MGEGVLTKLCRKKMKPRQFFLFNDILVYGNIMIHKKKVMHLAVFHLVCDIFVLIFSHIFYSLHYNVVMPFTFHVKLST